MPFRRIPLLLSLLLLASCGRRSGAERRGEEAGPPAPRAEAAAPAGIVLVDGNDVLRLGKAEGGKGFVVNVWASWCGPCKREFPMLIGLREAYKKAGIAILFVSVDEEATRDAAVRFAEEQGLLDTILVAKPPLENLKAALNPRWAGMLPATFLYDAQGKLRYYFGGPVYENELSPVVFGLARGEPIQGEAIFGLAPGMDGRPPTEH